MYTRPAVSRFGTFRDLTQFGCLGAADLVIPGVPAAIGTVPEVTIGPDGKVTTKICFAAVSGM